MRSIYPSNSILEAYIIDHDPASISRLIVDNDEFVFNDDKEIDLRNKCKAMILLGDYFSIHAETELNRRKPIIL
jgi:hypothetical protein